MDFLTALFQNGEGYSAINTARSALSTFFINESGLTIGKYPSVKRLLKGIFKLRPSLPRYNCIWDVNIVLDFLKNFYPYEGMELSILTKKLVMLLALASAQRVQTLQVLKVEDVCFKENLVIIPINELIKQSTPYRNKFQIKLETYEKEPAICVVTILKAYLVRTEELRSSSQLLISFQKPFEAVSKQTISRWIKSVMFEAGIDTEIFKSHSTRSAVCSKAKASYVPIENILETAGWSNARTFKKFYDKVIIEC